MKRLLSLTLILLAVAFGSCTKKTIIVKKPVPAPGKSAHAPGQIKKRTGAQSAAAYAPGQQKKAATSSSSGAKKPATQSAGNKKDEEKKK
jgi:hypothetical protein